MMGRPSEDDVYILCHLKCVGDVDVVRVWLDMM